MNNPDFVTDTRCIREWIRGGCISTDHLVAELTLWADYWAAGAAQDRLGRILTGTFGSIDEAAS